MTFHVPEVNSMAVDGLYDCSQGMGYGAGQTWALPFSGSVVNNDPIVLAFKRLNGNSNVYCIPSSELTEK